ncbi:MAG: FtsX-like permease family protein [Bacteroidetes bacterium]|nr:FtsX-like permease family protein [Bacteroidota bacterium]
MFQNYFKIALRNLLKYKSISAINLFGLTIGLASCLLIGLYITNELSFDRYHAKSDRIWRVNREFFGKDGGSLLHLGHVAPPFGPLLKNDFPEVEASVRMLQNGGVFRHNDQFYTEPDLFAAEPNIFKVFDIPVMKGNPATALNEPFSVMMDETTAEKYFPNGEPLNQTLKTSDNMELKVTGVFKDFPYNSHFHPRMLVSFSTLNNPAIYGEEQLRTNWSNNSFSTFLLLPKGYDGAALEAKFPAFIDKYMNGQFGDGVTPSKATSLDLTRLTDIHLHSHLDSEIEENGDIKRVWIFCIIALFVLLIACINYMNLSTARSTTRAKEIGVRKVVGAIRGELSRQFLTESVLMSLMATVLALVLAFLAMPTVNKLLGQQLTVEPGHLALLILSTAGLAILTGVVAGAYPALFLSKLTPLKTLKASNMETGRGSMFRKFLVVGQFAISSVLIIATMVVFRQLNFMQDKKLGLNKEQVLTMSFYNELAPAYESFRNEILSAPSVKNLTRSSRVPSGRLLDSFGFAKINGSNDGLEPSKVDLKMVRLDENFVPLYELGLVAGQNLKNLPSADAPRSFLLNEMAVKKIGWKSAADAVGQQISYGGMEGKVAGVLTDFNFESLHQGIQPMIMYYPTDSTDYATISVKLDGQQTQAGLMHLERTWKKFLPNYPFDYQFLNEAYGKLYEAEQRQGRVFIGFAMLAILVACLGLFGLASFVTEQRRKEIGIRKVLGATTSGLVGMLSKEFVSLVIIALVIAAPLAYYFMGKWLQDFAYRTDIQWGVFVMAGLVALGIAFLTVSFQSVKAALANPVKSLRSE